jgi:hypothetical protein
MTATRIPTGAARSLRVQLRSPKSKSFAATPFTLRVGQVKRTLANIRDFQENDVWFSNSIPCPQLSDSGPGSGNDHKPPDERTLKLGKSECVLHFMRKQLLIINFQPSVFSTTDYRPYLYLPFRKKSSLLKSLYDCFLPHILTYLQSVGRLHTLPRFGLHPLRGVGCPWWAMLRFTSCPSAWSATAVPRITTLHIERKN